MPVDGTCVMAVGCKLLEKDGGPVEKNRYVDRIGPIFCWVFFFCKVIVSKFVKLSNASVSILEESEGFFNHTILNLITQNAHLMIPHCHHSKEEAALTGAFGIEEVEDSEEGG